MSTNIIYFNWKSIITIEDWLSINTHKTQSCDTDTRSIIIITTSHLLRLRETIFIYGENHTNSNKALYGKLWIFLMLEQLMNVL
jgi:hypothetical protein